MPNYPDLQGKVAVVTGANGGMGLAITRALVAAGVSVLASDVQAQIDDSLQPSAELGYCQTDVSSESAVAAMLAAAQSRFGQIDCAVNAAAVEFETVRLHDCDATDFDRLMQVNLRGTFLCMKHELKTMLAQEVPGCIVNLASTTSVQPGRLQPAYGASKHAVLGLTRQAALDYARDGIRVNAIAPGNIDTPMLQNAITRRGIDAAVAQRHMPFGRFGSVDEIAEATLWLCSSASSFTTGHMLAVEGGMLLT